MFAYRMGPYIDADGWSIFGPLAGDATAVYVSTSGSTANSGLTPALPKLKPQEGMALLNTLPQGRPHRLCFKAGDEFPMADYPSSALSRNGRSDKELLLITSYDGDGNVPALTGARPKINVPIAASNGCLRASGGLFTSGGGYVGIVGLEFYAPERDPANGLWVDVSSDFPAAINWLNPCRFMLVEDCKMSFMSNCMQIQTPNACVWLRRNIVHNAWSGSTHSQGSFTDVLSFVLMQENFYYHNGWNDTATFGDAVVGDSFNQNFYIGAGRIYGYNGQTLFDYQGGALKGGRGECVGNITSRACANGMQLRPGGRMADNLFLHNGVTGFCAGKPSVMEYNVVLHGILRTGAGDGWGLNIINGANNTICRKNIVAHHEGTTANFGIEVRGASSVIDGSWPPIDGAQVLDNIIYDWDGVGIDDFGTNTVLTGNEIDAGGYSNPNRTLYTYDSEILGGPGTEAHFIAQCLARPARTWTAALSANAVNNYIRAGFDMPAYTGKPRFHSGPYEE